MPFGETAVYGTVPLFGNKWPDLWPFRPFHATILTAMPDSYHGMDLSMETIYAEQGKGLNWNGNRRETLSESSICIRPAANMVPRLKTWLCQKWTLDWPGHVHWHSKLYWLLSIVNELSWSVENAVSRIKLELKSSCFEKAFFKAPKSVTKKVGT